MEISHPLVSVVVITYNSAEYVLETLESAKAQTYQNIELIISDDGSKDATIDICKNWLEENASRFVRTELVTVPENTGIPMNCDRGVRAANGGWVKLIAGDDLLMDDCIVKNITFALKREKCHIVISDMISFYDGDTISQNQNAKKPLWIGRSIKNAMQQYKSLLLNFCGNTPTLFISRKIFDSVGFDPEIRHMEDYPFLLNVTQGGFKLDYMAETTVAYRISAGSASNYGTDKIFNDLYIRNQKFNKKYRYPNLENRRLIFEKTEIVRKNIINVVGLNRSTLFCRLIYNITLRLNPFYWFLSKEERTNIY